MADEKNLSPIWKNLLKKPLILLLAAAGVFLLLLGNATTDTSKKTAESSLVAETEAYRKALESDLVALCEQVSGAGKVSLLLTLDGSEEAVYAKDERQNGATDYVVSSGEGLLLYRKHPAVLGVAVVCTGGADPSVRGELTALLSAVLGIGSNRIHISYSQS